MTLAGAVSGDHRPLRVVDVLLGKLPDELRPPVRECGVDLEYVGVVQVTEILGERGVR